MEFWLGAVEGKVWIRNVTLTERGNIPPGLAGEDVKENIARPLPAEGVPAIPDARKFKVLFDGSSLAEWHPEADGLTSWKIVDGLLTNEGARTNLVSNQTFMDFELHLEFRLLPGSDSGVLLHNLYEIQLVDPALVGSDQKAARTGSVMGLLALFAEAENPVGEWQTLDIVFYHARRDENAGIRVHPRITIRLNNTTIIQEQEISVPTGTKMPSPLEGKPGSVVLQQGSSYVCQFRNILVRPTAMFPPTIPGDDDHPRLSDDKRQCLVRNGNFQSTVQLLWRILHHGALRTGTASIIALSEFRSAAAISG